MATAEEQALTFNPELQDVSRQRKLAELLMAQGMQQPQGQMISGRYVAPSFTQQLNPLANILAGQAIGERADTKQQDLATALRGKQQQVMQAWSQAKTPQEKFAIGTSEYAPPQLKAASYEMLKPQKLGEGETISQMNLGTGAYEPMAQGGIKVDPDTRRAMQFLRITKPIDQLTDQELQAVERKALDFKRAGAMSFVMPPAESEYAKTIGAGVGKQDLTLRDIAENSTKTIENIHNQRKLLDTGKVITGFGADQRLGLAQFGKAVGLTGKGDEDLASNTQNFLAGRAGSTLDAIQSSNLGSAQGFSNTDREFLQAAKLGGIKYDEKSLRRQLDLEERVARAATSKWNERVKSMPKSASNPINLSPIELPGNYQNPGVDKSNPLLR
jgi:hypothetical protein